MTDADTVVAAAVCAAARAFEYVDAVEIRHSVGRMATTARRCVIWALKSELNLGSVYAARRVFGSTNPHCGSDERRAIWLAANTNADKVAAIRAAIAPLCDGLRMPDKAAEPDPPPPPDPWAGADFSRHNLTPRLRGAFGRPTW